VAPAPAEAAPVAEDVVSSAEVEDAQPDLTDSEDPVAAQYVSDFSTGCFNRELDHLYQGLLCCYEGKA